MAPPPTLFDGIDTMTSLLIAHLSLEDIQDGEARFSGDEQYALQLMAEDFREYMETYQTYQQNRPISSGMGPGISGGDTASDSASVVSSRRSYVSSRSPSPDPGSPASRHSDIMSNYPHSDSVSVSSLGSSLYRGRSPSRDGYSSRSISPAPSTLSSVSDIIQTAECVACGDTVEIQSSFQAPCAHHYCEDCLEQLLANSTTAESLFPPWCCTPEQKIDVYTIITTDGHALPKLSTGVSINEDLSQHIHAKAIEYAVPYKDRVFCANPRCSVFLGSKIELAKATASPSTSPSAQCPTCSTAVCLECKQAAHPTGQKCRGNPIDGFDDASMAVRELAKEKEWQTCYACYEMVEKTSGCVHITCRCSAQFCYRCGVQWSSEHACPPAPTAT
ncbi:hypothetical protein PM082_021159 [Marasmius tenuissimus]|nr:hypothetical protein PM082_021159 [Marasmius tenuissimus]